MCTTISEWKSSPWNCVSHRQAWCACYLGRLRFQGCFFGDFLCTSKESYPLLRRRSGSSGSCEPKLDYAQLLLRDKGLSERAKGSALQIRQEARRLVQMIMNLLDISKGDEGKLSPKRTDVDLTALIRGLIDDLSATAQSRRVRLEARLERDTARVDEDLFRRDIISGTVVSIRLLIGLQELQHHGSHCCGQHNSRGLVHRHGFTVHCGPEGPSRQALGANGRRDSVAESTQPGNARGIAEERPANYIRFGIRRDSRRLCCSRRLRRPT